MKDYDHIIIGSSQAGLTAADTLASLVPSAAVALINGEDRPPYKRTHLTKRLAAGFTREEFSLYPEAWYRERKLDRYDSPAVSLEPESRTVRLESGQSLRARRSLLLATGARPRVPDIPGKEHFLHLRRADETELIRESMTRTSSVLVVGLGVEGVEMAEQCRLMGLEVTLTGRSGRLMSRWLDEELSRRLEELITSRGIRVRYNEEPLGLEKEGRSYRLTAAGPGVREELTAGVVLASTGICGETGLAENWRIPGLIGPGGVMTNEYLETVCPGIYAAGDIVQTPPGWATGLWHSAQKQGETAARNMAGEPTVWENVPVRLKCEVFGDFFFSMAYDKVAREVTPPEEWLSEGKQDYLRVFLKEERAMGALMRGMKGKAKELASLVERGAGKEAFSALLHGE